MYVIHAYACKQIPETALSYPQDVVIFRDGKYLTLQQVFESLNLTAYDLSIDTLDMHV